MVNNYVIQRVKMSVDVVLSFVISNRILTRALMGLYIFRHLMGGGVLRTPSTSAPGPHSDTR